MVQKKPYRTIEFSLCASLSFIANSSRSSTPICRKRCTPFRFVLIGRLVVWEATSYNALNTRFSFCEPSSCKILQARFSHRFTLRLFPLARWHLTSQHLNSPRGLILIERYAVQTSSSILQRTGGKLLLLRVFKILQARFSLRFTLRLFFLVR